MDVAQTMNLQNSESNLTANIGFAAGGVILRQAQCIACKLGVFCIYSGSVQVYSLCSVIPHERQAPKR